MKCAITDCGEEKCDLWEYGTCKYCIPVSIEGIRKILIRDQADMHGITPPDNSDCTWGGGSETK